MPNISCLTPWRLCGRRDSRRRSGSRFFPYMPADPVLARRLAEVGCATVMPLVVHQLDQGAVCRSAREPRDHHRRGDGAGGGRRGAWSAERSGGGDGDRVDVVLVNTA